MSNDPLLIRSVGVHAMPGIPRGRGFDVTGLGRGVNVIFGPNGSGKTTMARAIEEILWPGGDRHLRPHLDAALDLDGAAWQCDVDGTHVTWRRDGAEAPAPDVGAPDVRHRYRLALAEMLEAGAVDRDFAAEVALEMAGGFDLGAVARDGSFPDRPAGLRTLRNDLGHVRRRLDAAIAEEDALERRRVRELPDIARDLDDARAAEARRNACARALEHRRALDDRQRRQREREALPLDRLAACHANDEDTLKNLRRRRAELSEEHARVTTAIDAASRRLGGCAIPNEGIPAAALDELTEVVSVLGTHEQQRDELERSRPREIARRDENLQRLEVRLTREQIDALARFTDDEEVESLARDAHRLEAEREALAEARDRRSDTNAPDQADALPRIEDGFRCLMSWAAVSGGGPERRTTNGAGSTGARAWPPVVVLALVAAALSIILAVLLHPAWALALAAVVVAAWWALSRRGAAPADDPAQRRRTFQEEFERLDLPAPEAWSPEGVSERVRGLAGEMLEARTALDRRHERERLRRREEDFERREREHGTARADLERRLGLTLPVHDVWLPLFSKSLRHWQDAHERVVGIDRGIEEAARIHQAHLDRAAELIAAWGEASPTSRHTLDAAITRLRTLSQDARDRDALRARLLDVLEPARAEAEAEWSTFFTERGLADGDTDGLAALLADLEKMHDLERAIAEAEGKVRAERGPLADDHPDLLGLTVEALAAERDEQAAIAERRDELLKRQAAIEHELEQAGKGTSVTDARATLARAREALLEARQEEERRAAGQLLLERIAGASRQASLPAVFQRARRIFGRITSGRFELRPPDTEHGAFRALDVVDGMEKALEELSTGERVQLLLAVRLGFLEHRERSRLPLLLDETLGTSDDERAGAIMDALTEIARDGRQILYFTAQHDEAGKWRGRLENGDVPCHLVDLAAIRAGAEAELTPLVIRPVEETRIPAPEGRDYAAYGRALGAPGLDPFRQASAGQAHLWHALDDPHELHALLARNITTIGQFLNYRRSEGPLPPGTTERTDARIEAAARGLERVIKAWRRGRARPIELKEALDTGAVSATYEERFAALLTEVERDPETLLEALEAGRLTGFRRGNIEKLRAEFEARGILSDEERLAAADLEIRLSAEVASAIDDGLIDNAWIRRVVASLPDLDPDHAPSRAEQGGFPIGPRSRAPVAWATGRGDFAPRPWRRERISPLMSA